MKISDGELRIRIKQMEAMIAREECKRDDLKRELSITKRDIENLKSWWVLLKDEESKREREAEDWRRGESVKKRGKCPRCGSKAILEGKLYVGCTNDDCSWPKPL